MVADISCPPKADVDLFHCGVEDAVEEFNATDNKPISYNLKEFNIQKSLRTTEKTRNLDEESEVLADLIQK